MSDATVLKSFLVSLGFKTDEASMKKFNDGIQSATKAVAGLAAAVVGMSVGVAVGVAKFTASLENLYFVSKRTKTSVLNIKAVDLAARDLGASGEEARGALEGLAKFIRNTPNAGDFFKGMGVQAKDAKGHWLDTSDILANMSDKFQELQKTGQKGMVPAYASMFGISDNMQFAMMDPHFASIIQKYRRQNKGTDWNKEASKAHDQMDKIREMQSKMDALKMRVGQDMEQLSDKVLPIFDKILQKILALDKATNGWSTDVALVGTAFLALLGPITRVTKALKGLFAIGAGEGAAAGGAAAGGAAAAEGAAAGAAASGMPSVFRGRGAKAIMGAGEGAGAAAGLGRFSRFFGKGPIAAFFAMMGYSQNANAGEDAMIAKWHSSAGKAKDAMAFFMSKGWTQKQAAGIVANLMTESHLDPTSRGDGGLAYGIAQWHPDRQAAFKKWAGHDLHQSNLQEQLAFVQYEMTKGAEARAGSLLRAARNARQAGRVVSRYYERPGVDEAARAAQAAKRGELAVKIDQQTNIHVHGVSDPHKAAKATAHEQRSVNSDLLRNTKGAIQ